jgi:hypothetical protein
MAPSIEMIVFYIEEPGVNEGLVNDYKLVLTPRSR